MAKTEMPAGRAKKPMKKAMAKAAAAQKTAKMPGKPDPDMKPNMSSGAKPPTDDQRLDFMKKNTAMKKRRKRNIGRS